jgi:hypothetical protein
MENIVESMHGIAWIVDVQSILFTMMHGVVLTGGGGESCCVCLSDLGQEYRTVFGIFTVDNFHLSLQLMKSPSGLSLIIEPRTRNPS